MTTDLLPAVQLDAQPPLPNPLGFGEADWQSVLTALDQPAWRARQLLKWIHGRGVTDYDAMTDLPVALRLRLGADFPIAKPEILEQSSASDGVVKYLFQVSADQCIEAVLIPASGRMTLCISSQVGCALGCTFCETGRQGFARNLSAAEIIGQLWAVRFGEEPVTISNVVLMGMGEPLLNLPAVEPALELMFSDFAYGLARRRVTLSTAGMVPGIRALRAGPTLALSLHAPDDALRNRLVPINRKYPIAEVLEACMDYLRRLPDRRPLTVEYTLLRGINDSPQQASALAALLRGISCKVNLIPCNPVAGLDFLPPSEKTMSAFAGRIAESMPVTLRRPRGLEVNAACGQLAGRVTARNRVKSCA